MKKPVVQISDHALIRYLERVLGMDIEGLRREIGHKVDTALEHDGCTGIVVDGFSYKMRAGKITTVMRVGRADIRTGRRPRTGEIDL